MARTRDSLVPIERTGRGGVGVPIFDQDQFTGILGLPFLTPIGTATLTDNTAINTYTITVGAGHGMAAGNIIEIADTRNGSYFMQAIVITAGATTITLDRLINRVYVPEFTSISISSRNINVNGETIPVIFSLKPNANQSGDITRIILTITGTAAMDFQTFGSIPALTRGILLRQKFNDGTYRNIGCFKTNGEIENAAFDRNYFVNNGGGVRGFSSRLTFNGKDKHGVVIRLEGKLLESLECVIQDNLTSLSTFRILGQGSELQE